MNNRSSQNAAGIARKDIARNVRREQMQKTIVAQHYAKGKDTVVALSKPVIIQ